MTTQPRLEVPVGPRFLGPPETTTTGGVVVGTGPRVTVPSAAPATEEERPMVKFAVG